jgi:hypothetical protein
MNIDWSATGSWMQAWAGFAQAGAVFIAAAIATNTYKSWRKQKLEERRIEAAERVLTLAYRVKDAFTVIRSPVRSSAATDEAIFNLINSGLNLEEISKEKREKIVESQVILDRINRYVDLWQEFSATLPVGSALLGEETDAALRNLWRQKTVICVAAEQYPDDDGLDPKFSSEISYAIWESKKPETRPNDKVAAQISDSVQRLEDLLLPVIRMF